MRDANNMNILSLIKQQKLHTAFLAGLGIRASAREAGVNRKTAVRYFVDSGAHHLCKCGKPAIHRGWCSYRVSRSRPRQIFLMKQFNAGINAAQQWSNLQSDISGALAALVPLHTLAIYKTAATQRRISNVDPDLRRNFDAYGTGRGWEYAPDGLASHVAITPELTGAPIALLKATETLHPVVRRFVFSIIEGADVEGAASEVGLSEQNVQLLMPRLKVFLEPYLR